MNNDLLSIDMKLVTQISLEKDFTRTNELVIKDVIMFLLLKTINLPSLKLCGNRSFLARLIGTFPVVYKVY